jgi:hypothetical protein
MFMRPGEIKEQATPGDWDPSFHQSRDDLWDMKSRESNYPPVGGVGYKYLDRNQETGGLDDVVLETSLKDEIRKNGVQTPVHISHHDTEPAWSGVAGAVLENGHHRVQAAHEIEQETGKQVYIPVNHSERRSYGW